MERSQPNDEHRDGVDDEQHDLVAHDMPVLDVAQHELLISMARGRLVLDAKEELLAHDTQVRDAVCDEE